MKIDSPFTDNTPVGPAKNGYQATATTPSAPVSGPTYQNGTTAQRSSEPVDAVNGAAGTPASASNVHLSAAAAHLRAAASDSSSDIDHARVAQIKAAIANGSYRTDSSKIADGMLRSSQELLPTPKA